MRDELIAAVGRTVYDNLAPEYLLLTTQQGELARDVITTVLEFLALEFEMMPETWGFVDWPVEAAAKLRAMAKEAGKTP